MRRVGLAAVAAAALAGLALCGCGRSADEPPSSSAPVPSATVGIVFADATAAAGLDFVHFNGMTGEYLFPEMMGGGGALLDYDGDGDLDLYLVQGRRLERRPESRAALFGPRHPEPLTDRLYRNDLLATGDGGARASLVDVTARAGLPPSLYGMGAATGDVDGDGDVDLYVTAFGPNRLLVNRGDGTFRDATADSGAGDPRWSVAATFFDSDLDGDLDLYVGNYLDYTLATDKVCLDAAGARDYCGPAAYLGVSDRLLANRGDGVFVDVSAASGVGGRRGRGLGAVAADLDGDGWPDLYVANDGEPNFLWINRRDGTFEDEAPLAGAAVDADGRPQASMGVDAGDYDGDGDLDLFLTHLGGEANTLYRNDGALAFTDVSRAAGLAAPSLPLTGFGAGWRDFDGDGRLDLLIANGAVKTIGALARAGDPYPLHQRKLLFRGVDGRRFDEASASAGEVFARSEVGRGVAFGDFDNDGDVDALVVNNNGSARLLENRSAGAGSWLGAGLRGAAGGFGGVGARVVVRPSTGTPVVRRVATDGSYAAASDPRVVVGLGEAPGPATVSVEAPDGRTVEWRDLEAERYYVLWPR